MTIKSVPSGAEIYWGSRPYGRTPRAFYSDKPLVVTLRRAGYRPHKVEVPLNKRGALVVRLATRVPAWKRTHSLRKLKQHYRAGKMSRFQWKMRIKVLKHQRDQRIRAVKQQYRAGRISRHEYKQRVRLIKDHYR